MENESSVGWIVLQEFWNDPLFDAPGATRPREEARVSVVLKRRNGSGRKLRFGAEMESPVSVRPQTWTEFADDFEIPYGKWITQEFYVKEGTGNDGRFYMAVTVDGKKTVLIDKAGPTTSTVPGYVPDGQTAWNPIKLYTEGRVPEVFKAAGKTMDVYWDDLEIWRNKRPE